MVEIAVWMTDFSKALKKTFGNRVWFIGLQGSYSRGEATEQSDIDVVVILDHLSCDDIKTYNTMLDTLHCRELICGFLSGKDEIMNWDTADLFQFYHDTVPVKGCLDELLTLIDSSSIDRAIKTGVCNIYHGCVHNMLHEKSEDILKGLYKSASFVIQAIAFRENGNYIRSKTELLTVISPEEKTIINTALSIKNGGQIFLGKMSEELFVWSQNIIKGIK